MLPVRTIFWSNWLRFTTEIRDLVYPTPASYNQVINCDSSFNYDPEENGQDADGFAAKGPTDSLPGEGLGPGNVFRGCRSWNNSDDGFDFWWAGNGVMVEDCWAWRNGKNVWNDPNFTGNANGFKLGQGRRRTCINPMLWHTTIRKKDLT